MSKLLIINFLTKDMHIQKDPIDYNELYSLVEKGISSVKNQKLTPKNKEKIERKLRYLDNLDLSVMDEYHEVDDYSLTLLRSEYGLLPKLKNKILYNNRIYRFIFEYYEYKHEISYDEFVKLDSDFEKLAVKLDINIDLVLQKKSSTLEQLSLDYNCTRESIRLRIIDAKKYITARYSLPNYNYVLETNFEELSYIDKLVLLARTDDIWYDCYKAYILNTNLVAKLIKFDNEIEKLKIDYNYPIRVVESNIYPLIESYVNNDSNLYIENNIVFSLVKNGEHHNANYVLNFLKIKNIKKFYIEDLLHDDFLSTKHGKLMSNNITTSLRNLEAILDREETLLKLDTHHYILQSAIPNIKYLDFHDITRKLSAIDGTINIELLSSLFEDEINMLNIETRGFYYLLKKNLFDKFKFRKLVIYNTAYKLQTKYEILAANFDSQKVIILDENLLSNATNLARKFKDKGGLIYGDKLYNTNLLSLSKKLKGLKITSSFDNVIYRNTFNQTIDQIVLDEIDYKRKFAFKLWCFLNGYEYFNFYAKKDNKYSELHTLVYAINDKKSSISYSKFIDIIEQISGSRKVYQILQNLIDSQIVDCHENQNGERTITFKEEIQIEQPDTPQVNDNSFRVNSKLEQLKLIELRALAKSAHIKNINKYNKNELISILRNTVKVEELD